MNIGLLQKHSFECFSEGIPRRAYVYEQRESFIKPDKIDPHHIENDIY